MSIQEIISVSQSGTRAIGAKRNYEYTYRVKAEPGDDVNSVLLDPQVPSLGASVNSDRRATIKNKKASRVDSANSIWDVTLSLDTEPIPQAAVDADTEENPLERPAEVSWDYIAVPKILVKTVDETPLPIANTVGEEYDPGIEDEEGIIVLYVTRNERNYSVSTMLDYGNTTNSNTFYGAAAGVALLKPPRAQRVVENDLVYWRVSYEVHFKRDGWKATAANKGMKYRIVPDAPLFPVTVAGQPATEPQYLNEDGTLRDPDTDDVFFNEFTVKRSKNFGPLKLENV